VLLYILNFHDTLVQQAKNGPDVEDNEQEYVWKFSVDEIEVQLTPSNEYAFP
jgi:hypothetical protein